MDFTQEFWHTATVAWACGIMSVLCAVEAWRQRAFRWQLIGGVLAGLTGVLCPATLTRGYYEMVVVNQELAAVVAAKRAEGVSHGGIVQLAAADVVESRGGGRFERRTYTDGRSELFRSVPPIPGRIGRGTAEDGSAEPAYGGFIGPVLELPKIARSHIY